MKSVKEFLTGELGSLRSKCSQRNNKFFQLSNFKANIVKILKYMFYNEIINPTDKAKLYPIKR